MCNKRISGSSILEVLVALFVLALFPQFVVIGAGSVALQIMVFATVINVLGFFVNGAVILMASKATSWFVGSDKTKMVLHKILACVFFGLALRLVFDSRTD